MKKMKRMNKMKGMKAMKKLLIITKVLMAHVFKTCADVESIIITQQIYKFMVHLDDEQKIQTPGSKLNYIHDNPVHYPYIDAVDYADGSGYVKIALARQ
jgi:hypothetical protein